jgi:putative transposase
MSDDTPSPLNNVITIDDERIKSHLDRVVRGTVEETLNALLDAEADRLCNAQRYERSDARRDTRAGHYERGLQTKAGEVRLRVPKLRQQTFETAIIERYRRRESLCPCSVHATIPLWLDFNFVVAGFALAIRPDWAHAFL